MQATLAAVGLIAGIGGWLSAGSTASLVAGAVLGLAIPYTLIAILPTNKHLLAPSAADDLAKAERLLAKWQALHAGRTVLGLCAFSVFAWDLAIR